MRAPINSPLRNLSTKVCVFENAKGGVGKTITSVMIARILAKRGRKVLFVDADGQANATEQFGYKMSAELCEKSTKRLFDGKDLSLDEIISKTSEPNLSLMPSHMQLFIEEQRAAHEIQRGNSDYPMGRIVRKRFEDSADIVQKFDYIIVDCNPYMGEVSRNFFCISDSIICPVDGPDALIGVLTTIRMWEEAKRFMVGEMGTGEATKEAECLAADDYYIVMNKFQETKVSRHLYDILKGRNLTERESTLFGDFKEAFVECPIPLRTAIMEESRLCEGEKKSLLDDTRKETEAIRSIYNTLADNLLKEGAL